MGMPVFLIAMMILLHIRKLKLIKLCNLYLCTSLLYISCSPASPLSTCLLAPPLSRIPSGQLTLRNVVRDGPAVVVQCAECCAGQMWAHGVVKAAFMQEVSLSCEYEGYVHGRAASGSCMGLEQPGMRVCVGLWQGMRRAKAGALCVIISFKASF
ncbi:hypothetical protein HJG60_011179 [Phyllostomus discolor]|uniref:Uncharacterized protein n=1 Tax=Phyllostomus discolor TaxID=89673 RepID=A0A834A733_9CHIR|nr:hypothetical protein HJG60_011179 [Phyllostomus discolor]